MLFGHNTNVKVGDTVYHLQTEDRGTANALIDTTVYCLGRVLHRRTHNYFDLLPLDVAREESLKKRIDEQHRSVAEEIRSGALLLVPPPSHAQQNSTTKEKAGSAAHSSASPAPPLALELVNAKSWLAGKRANLHVAVRKQQNGEAIARALVTARIDGAADVTEFSTETGPDGHARLEFEMPRLAGAEPALVIEATQEDSKGHLKFQLRARPRVPTA
ncbi:MAG: hypothetical protein WA621_16795 [Candidatus Acidiferrum sp.]|jgi:hypothetical protein